MAAAHARAAEQNGAAGGPLQITGLVLSIGGLGGLGGLYYLGKNDAAVAGILLGGFGVQLLGLVLVGIGAQAKVNANGHAVDAMNYYNDAVGSRGRPARRRRHGGTGRRPAADQCSLPPIAPTPRSRSRTPRRAAT